MLLSSNTTLLNAGLYLLPSLVVAHLLRRLAHRFLIFSALVLPGTMLHEFLHLVTGLLTNARPVSLSIWPRRVAGGYQLGAVGFANIRWYNAALVGLSPLLGFALAIWLAFVRTLPENRLGQLDIAVWYVSATLLICSWPSKEDWRLASASWPLLPPVLGSLIYWLR